MSVSSGPAPMALDFTPALRVHRTPRSPPRAAPLGHRRPRQAHLVVRQLQIGRGWHRPTALCRGHSSVRIASLGPCCPGLVGLGCVHALQLFPSSNGVALRAARVLRHEVGNEVDVAPVLDTQRALFRLVQYERLFYEMAVGDAPAGTELLFAPAVEQVASTGLALEPWLQLRGLALDEVLRLAIARVVHNGKVQA